MGSDGIWDFISSEQSCNLVHGVMMKAGEAASCEAACAELVDKAFRCWEESKGDYRDDITAFVVALPLFGKAQPVTPRTAAALFGIAGASNKGSRF